MSVVDEWLTAPCSQAVPAAAGGVLASGKEYKTEDVEEMRRGT